VQPLRPPGDPKAGLVQVLHPRGRDVLAHDVSEAPQPLSARRAHPGDGRWNQLQAEQKNEAEPSNVRIFFPDLTFDGLFGSKSDILNPRWLLTGGPRAEVQGRTQRRFRRLLGLKSRMAGYSQTSSHFCLQRLEAVRFRSVRARIRSRRQRPARGLLYAAFRPRV
jgi:hypothetical protein